MIEQADIRSEQLSKKSNYGKYVNDSFPTVAFMTAILTEEGTEAIIYFDTVEAGIGEAGTEVLDAILTLVRVTGLLDSRYASCAAVLLLYCVTDRDDLIVIHPYSPPSL